MVKPVSIIFILLIINVTCIVFGRSQVQILPRSSAILTETFHGFLQSLHDTPWWYHKLGQCSATDVPPNISGVPRICVRNCIFAPRSYKKTSILSFVISSRKTDTRKHKLVHHRLFYAAYVVFCLHMSVFSLCKCLYGTQIYGHI